MAVVDSAAVVATRSQSETVAASDLAMAEVTATSTVDLAAAVSTAAASMVVLFISDLCTTLDQSTVVATTAVEVSTAGDAVGKLISD